MSFLSDKSPPEPRIPEVFFPVGSPGRRPSHLFFQLCRRRPTAAADAAVLHLRSLFTCTLWDGTLAFSSSSAEGGDGAAGGGPVLSEAEALVRVVGAEDTKVAACRMASFLLWYGIMFLPAAVEVACGRSSRSVDNGVACSM